MEAQLDINTEATQRGYTFVVTVTGQATEPDISFRSVPELPEDVRGSPLVSPDLAPVPAARRNWTTYNFAALWISMAHCIPTYMLASGLIGAGMNWWQALVTILLGNTIVLVLILLNSHPGTKYGIPFPVFERVSYGTSDRICPRSCARSSRAAGSASRHGSAAAR